MTCKEFKKYAYLSDDELDAETLSRRQRHRSECTACALEYGRIERARRMIRELGERQPVLTDPLLLVNAVIGRIERDAAVPTRSLPVSLVDRLIIRLSSPGIRAALASALLLIAGSFVLEYTSAFVQMKTFEVAMGKKSAMHEQYETAGMEQNRLLSAASEVTKFISGKRSSLELTDQWLVMNKQSFEEFLLLYHDLKSNAAQLPPEFREAHPELTKLLETEQPSAQMSVVMKDRESLIRELNGLVSSER
jgi:hypothetical protein